MQSIDKYVVQALDNYPYYLEESLESLGYALAYDDKNVVALCLYGRFYAEQLQDYEAAKEYYSEALAIDINAVMVYPYYAETLFWNDDLDEALKLIDFSLTVKGIDKVIMLLKKVKVLEKQQQWKIALQLVKEAKLLDFSNYSSEIEETEKRIKSKRELLKGKKKKKSKKDRSKSKKRK
ncbi:hypothetical protein NHF50_10935 [Flavobacterium sp. NRK F10]|uniref:tetratricopeptide repeat protein n=1 Tax=Flavobacterium sp. NRK F10 TaxID=2954931 RepID=UPI0020900F7B|nr:hypothetical protein [Flavobacterium sp. NRK F10]MCO6175556.1 hypothetical protein [Flavobacterium sp. NRK F10]